MIYNKGIVYISYHKTRCDLILEIPRLNKKIKCKFQDINEINTNLIIIDD